MSQWKVYRGFDYIAQKDKWVARHTTKAYLNEFFDSQEEAIAWIYSEGRKVESR